MLSFIPEFDREYGNKLGVRYDTFRRIFEILEQKEKRYFTIVETGCMRAHRPRDWQSDGLSTLLFDKFINFHNGMLYSVDINPSACGLARRYTSQKTTLVCSDSVSWLWKLAKQTTLEIDLLYLDSFEPQWDNLHPSALHHFKELCAILPILKNGTLIVVDDTVKTVGLLPRQIENRTEHIMIRDTGVTGNGIYIDDFLTNIGCKRVIEGYQTGYILNK